MGISVCVVGAGRVCVCISLCVCMSAYSLCGFISELVVLSDSLFSLHRQDLLPLDS